MSNKKVLIGGGTGFIGKRLGDLLCTKGYNATNISRSPGPNNIKWTQIQCEGLPKGVHAVMNCAGQPFMDLTKKWTERFKQDVIHSRVCTTQTLAAAIKTSHEPPKVFIVIAGVAAYEPSETKKYDESSPSTGKDFFSKLTFSLEKTAQIAASSTRLVIIRSGAVLGRWGGMIQNMYMSFFLGLGGPIGSGKQYLPWIHIDDLVRLILFAIENENVVGILNGVAPHVITNGEFAKAFAKALGRPAIIPVPEKVMNFLFSPERAMIVLKGQHVVPKKVLECGFQYKYKTIEEACKELAPFSYKKPEFE